MSACIGDQLVLLCNVTGNVLKWGINLFSSTAGDEPYSRILSIFSETTYLQVNNTQFTFSRVSPSGTSPIESLLLISPVSSYLNGTMVNCMTELLVIHRQPPLTSSLILVRCCMINL